MEENKMQIRKIISGAIGLVMATATLAFPALAAEAPSGWPSPYVESNVADYTVVYGAVAAASDANAADDIASALADQVVPTDGGVELEGGTSLSTRNTPLYMGDGWNAAFDTLTDSHLPNVLAGGTAVSTDGTEYDYKQYVMLVNRSNDADNEGVLSFGTPGDLDDPVLHIEIGTNADQSPYYSKVTFVKNLNVTSGDRGLSGDKIELFGKEFVISSDSTAGTDLVLFGASNMMTMKAKEEKTISVSGEDYLVKIISVVDSNTATVSVDGTSKDIDEGNTKKIGGLEVYVDTVDYYQDIVEGVAIDSGDVKIVFGSEKLTFQNGLAVTYGSSGDTLEGTKCFLSWDSNNDLSEMRVNASSDDSDKDFISPGNCFKDRVWETFEFCLGDVDPGLTSDDRDKIVLEPTTDTVKLEFTTEDDEEVSIEIANIVDLDTGNPKLQDASDNAIYVREWNNTPLFKGGPNSYGENSYFVTNDNSYSHMFQITDINSVGSVGAEVKIKDILTGTSWTIPLEDTTGYTNGSTVIDGTEFFFQANSTSGTACNSNCGVNVTWGTNANFDEPGSSVSLFAGLETSKGAWISLITNVTANNETFELPYKDGSKEYGTQAFDSVAASDGGLDSTFWNAPANATYVTAGVGAGSAGEGPGIFLLEEKDDGEVRNAVVAFVGYDTTDKRITLNHDLFNMTHGSNPDFATKSGTSDNYVEKWLDRYGTYAIVTSSQDGGGRIEIYYPDEQATWDVRVGEVGEIASGGGVASATAIMDTDVTDAQKNTSNIIVVGGPCVNTLAADLLDVEFPACGADSGWEEGDQLIEEYISQFKAGNTALLVAGWEAADTTAVADMLVEALA
jgi:hypothetical protein